MRYRSRFGGLWTDRSDAKQTVQERVRTGSLSPEQTALLGDWIDNGFVVLKNAVPRDVVEQVLVDMEEAWTGKNPAIKVALRTEEGVRPVPAAPDLKHLRIKMLNLYANSTAALRAIFAPAIGGFLRLIFERPPLAFQSLSFTQGTEQPMHQDSAYVIISSPMELAASWIALEDVKEGTGELEYYVGSHKIEEYLFEGKSKKMPVGSTEHARYLRSIQEKSKAMGLRRERFLPSAGDAVIWAADLAHGGSKVVDRDATRYSLVTHYCPVEHDPEYYAQAPYSAKFPFGRDHYFTFKM